MLREQLIENLRGVMEQKGYTLISGFKYQMSDEATIYPVAWLSPLKVAKVEGRLEGIITYKVEMKLLNLNYRYDSSEKESVWSEMEQDVIAMCSNLISQPYVFDVENIKAEPTEFTLTNQGELAMNAEFNVKMNFICK